MEREMPPAQCRTMEELRAAIDALDLRLVALLAQRQRYIERAAQIKADRGAVRDPSRIEEVIAKVVAAAEAGGLSPAIAEPVWRCLIERSIALELEFFDAKDEKLTPRDRSG